MGSYCDYKLGDWELDTRKSYVSPQLTTAFHEIDKETGFIEEDGDKYRYVKYVCTAEIARNRLDALGYTVKTAENILMSTRKKWIREYGYLLPSTPKGLKKCFLESTIDDWIEAYRIIRENNYRGRYGDWDDEWDVVTAPNLVRLALGTGGAFFGFPAEEQYVLRLFLESCPKSLPVTLDVSELVSSGYYGIREKICDNNNYANKIIIITEGSTDKEFLEKSQQLLFPYMVDCYTFIDFSTFFVAGGVDKVTHIIKTFSGTGIQNKIIALFDNDAVGVREYNSLKKLKLPSNITVLKLPDIEMAKKYPTIGPTGNVTTDINGKACSLELYFGVDILQASNRVYEPIIWGGYIDPIVGYHGEIKNKGKIQNDFREKVNWTKKSTKRLKYRDWSGLRLVWEHIFNAYK